MTTETRKQKIDAIEQIGHGPCEGCGEGLAEGAIVLRVGRLSNKRDVCRDCWRTERDPGNIEL